MNDISQLVNPPLNKATEKRKTHGREILSSEHLKEIGRLAGQAVQEEESPTVRVTLTPCMTGEGIAFLSLPHLPARLNVWQSAVLLNCTEEDVRILARLGVLPKLNEAPGTTLFIALADIEALMASSKGMKRLTLTLNAYWSAKAAAKKNGKQE